MLSKINRPTWSRGQDIDINKMKQGSAGIIPYFIDGNGIAKFCFGVCTKSSELIELGGKCENDDINIEHTALRCFREETLGIFNISKRTLQNSDHTLYLYDEDDLLIFVRIDPLTVATAATSPRESNSFSELGLVSESINKIIQLFNRYNTGKTSPRIRTLTWLHELEISSIITFFNPQMPLRLRCLLRDVAKLIPVLKGSDADPVDCTGTGADSISVDPIQPDEKEINMIEPVSIDINFVPSYFPVPPNLNELLEQPLDAYHFVRQVDCN